MAWKIPILMIKNLFYCFLRRFPFRLILCDLDLSQFPKSTAFSHPYGLAVTASKIGENLRIRHNVTIGHRRKFDGSEPGPKIGDNVWIHSGAIILGPITIGDNSIIGAGSVVLEDVPANTIVYSRHELIRRDRI